MNPVVTELQQLLLLLLFINAFQYNSGNMNSRPMRPRATCPAVRSDTTSLYACPPPTDCLHAERQPKTVPRLASELSPTRLPTSPYAYTAITLIHCQHQRSLLVSAPLLGARTHDQPPRSFSETSEGPTTGRCCLCGTITVAYTKTHILTLITARTQPAYAIRL